MASLIFEIELIQLDLFEVELFELDPLFLIGKHPCCVFLQRNQLVLKLSLDEKARGTLA